MRLNTYQAVHSRVSAKLLDSYKHRTELVVRYAWAVPNDEAIQTIAKYAPIIEVGAGTGYWASLIARVAKIDAYDLNPPTLRSNTYNHSILYYPVLPVECLKWERTVNKTLMLCWPPYASTMASDCLLKFRGKTVIYIGEGCGGCTGDDKFHNELVDNWEQLDTVRIPQWEGIHDRLEVWARR